MLAEFAPLATAKNIDLGLSESSVASAAVRGDVNALRTLVSNLVDNAVRYTPAGGQVDVALNRERNTTMLAVRDTGTGIASEDRPRVFDRFYRGSSAGDSRGSGLGLAIVKSIADRHGATIRLDTGLEGRGLSVSIQFPNEPTTA